MKNLIKSKKAMRAFMITGMLAIVSVTFLAFFNSKLPASHERATITFTEEFHDFGKVEEGTQLEYSYKFTNEGDEPLVIEKVQPSCGCTGAATDGQNEYAKGESGEIKVTFNSQGRKGHQEKHITVITNDTKNPKKDLKFSCDITDSNDKNN